MYIRRAGQRIVVAGCPLVEHSHCRAHNQLFCMISALFIVGYYVDVYQVTKIKESKFPIDALLEC